jgi:hypothetical protein
VHRRQRSVRTNPIDEGLRNMTTNGAKMSRAVTLALIWCVVALGWLNGEAQAQRGQFGPSKRGGRSRNDQVDRQPKGESYATGGASIFERPPHGGQVISQLPYIFEVVYQPRETHLFLYDSLQQPLAAEGVQAEVLMQPHYAQQSLRFPLRFVAPAPGSPEQNHVSTAVDVSHVPDEQMTVTFRLDGLPDRQRPRVAFTHLFALTKPLPQVVVVPVTEADREAIERQQICPVEGAKLGSNGVPVKVLLNDQPLYLCCQGCVAKVRERPLLYVPRPVAPRVAQLPASR